MTTRVHRTLALAALLLGTAAALTACTPEPARKTADPPPRATGSTTEPQSAPPSAEPTGTRSSGATASTRPPGDATGSDGCPVGDTLLLRVVQQDDRFAPTSGFTGITCYKGWATAGQIVDRDYRTRNGPVQPVTFIFQYDPNAGRWNIVSGGTGGDCPKSMPAETRAHHSYCQR